MTNATEPTASRRRVVSAALAVCILIAGCSGGGSTTTPERASGTTAQASVASTTTGGPTDPIPQTSTTAPADVATDTIPEASTTTTSPPKGSSGLRELADRRSVEVGAAVAIDPLRDEADYREVLAREFNVLVAEDAMKWDALRPSRDAFDFAAADEIVAFAEANDMSVRGHTLVWFNALPPWLEGLNLTRDEAVALLEEHITTVVGRYRGRISQWDVVNEALPEGEDRGLRENVWLRWIGEDYIDLAFRFAHAADPDAELYLNDYDWETPGSKTEGIIELTRQLKNRGVPIDGVGIQFHVLGNVDLPAVERNLQAVSDLGLDVALTEVDNGRVVPLDAAALEQQASVFGGLLQTCLQIERCGTYVMWGFTDRHSWIPDAVPSFGGALVFDEALNPKPAYWALRAALEG